MLTKADLATTPVTVAFGAVTAGYTALRSLTRSIRMIVITNTLDATVTLSLDDGVSDFLRLQAGKDLTLDFGANAIHVSGVLRMKYAVGAPTAGEINFTFIAGN
jgi:hypothetical protein